MVMAAAKNDVAVELRKVSTRGGVNPASWSFTKFEKVIFETALEASTCAEAVTEERRLGICVPHTSSASIRAVHHKCNERLAGSFFAKSQIESSFSFE